MPRSTHSGFWWTISSMPCRCGHRSRISYIARNFHVVSTCSSGNGGLAGWNALQRQVQHHRAVLADGVQHHRPLALGDGLADDVDALRLQPLQVGQHQRFLSSVAFEPAAGTVTAVRRAERSSPPYPVSPSHS